MQAVEAGEQVEAGAEHTIAQAEGQPQPFAGLPHHEPSAHRHGEQPPEAETHELAAVQGPLRQPGHAAGAHQHDRVDQGLAHLQPLHARRQPERRRALEHDVGGKQRREDQALGGQEDHKAGEVVAAVGVLSRPMARLVLWAGGAGRSAVLGPTGRFKGASGTEQGFRHRLKPPSSAIHNAPGRLPGDGRGRSRRGR